MSEEKQPIFQCASSNCVNQPFYTHVKKANFWRFFLQEKEQKREKFFDNDLYRWCCCSLETRWHSKPPKSLYGTTTTAMKKFRCGHP